MVLFFFPYAGSMRGFFSTIYCEKLVELLEVKPQKYGVVGFLCLDTLSFLTLRAVHPEPPAIHQLAQMVPSILIPAVVSASESGKP